MSRPEDRTRSRMGWLVGRVMGGSEFETAGRLRRQGVRVKCPGYIAVVRPGRLRKGVRKARPAFPGYVFLDRGSVIDLERICLKTKGFLNIVSFDDDYADCDDEELNAAIAYVRNLERRNAFGGMPRKKQKKQIKAGAMVKISEGPFRNFDGKVTQRRGNSAKLHVEIFGDLVTITVPVEDLVLQSQ